MKSKLYFLFFAVLSCLGLHAQVTTSGLSGMIKGDDNTPLPGAVIKATHVSSGTVYTTVTNESGYYAIQGMRPGGPYTVEISAMGMQAQTINDIMLPLGDAFVLNRQISPGTAQELKGIVISAHKDAILNSDRTGASTNISNRTINEMPTITRSITDFTRLTPQANNNGFAGRDGRLNNLQIDGANFNNGFGLSSDPLPGGSNQPVSLDAIDEIQVNIAPYDVRQTGFTGAGINAVTRSGTNQVTGSVYGFFRPKSFTGLNVGDQQLSDLSRTSGLITGARLGAPLVKNKLFIFGDFEYETKQAAGNNWLAARPGLSGPNVTRVSADDLDAVSNFLKTKYGYDPGAYENYANNYNNRNIKALLRLDWNINDKNKLTIRYNIMRGTSQQETNASSGPNPRSASGRISSESIAFQNANYSFLDNVQSLTAELNSAISPKVSNQLLATYSHIRDTRQTPGSLFPFVDIWKDGSNYMSFGTELFSYGNDVVNNNVSVTDNLTYTLGKHLITGGISFQTMSYANSYLREGTSYYRYNSVADFLDGGAPSAYAITYPYDGSDGYARVKFGLGGIYIQDKIAVSEKLNITLGIRADVPFFLDNPPANPVIDTIRLLNPEGAPTTYTTAKWPKSAPLFSPRVGFNYDVLGDRTLQLRGGTGIFTGNIPFVWFTNMPTNAGVLQNTFEPVDSATLSHITHLEKDPHYWQQHLPGSFPNKPGTKAPGSFNLIDPDFKMPQVWRSDLGIDYKVRNAPLILSADLIYTKDIHAVYQFNANRKPASEKLDNNGDNRDYWGGSANAGYNHQTGSIIPVLSNTNKGASFAATFGVTLSEWKGLSGSLFYTYTSAKDVSGNPGSAANSAWSNNYSVNDPNELLLGYSQYAIPHRFVGSISYRKEYIGHLATTVSLFYQGANQGRFAYTYGGDVNADGVSLDLLYLPQNSNDIRFVDIVKNGEVVFTAAQQRKAYDAFVANDRNLSASRGNYVERNAGLMPWINRFDFRLLQDVFVYAGKHDRRHTLQLSLDILNVGNLLNKNWGLYKQLNGGSDYNYPLLNVVDQNGVPSTGKGYQPSEKPYFQMIQVQDNNGKTVLPTTPFRDLFSTNSTWGMQIGLRYSF